MKIRIFCLLAAFALLAPQAAWSQTQTQTPPNMSVAPVNATNGEPSRDDLKESLLAAWEKNIAKDPDTQMFEKTSEPGVYYIQTNLLPYKGRIKILNFMIRPYTPTAEYDKRIGYGGVVETGFMDADNGALNKTLPSAQEWERLNWFNFDKAKGEWFPTNKWQEHFPAAKYTRIETPLSVSNEVLPSFMDVIVMVAEVTFGVFFVVFLGFATIYGYRQHKIKASMDEHTQILKDILAAIREK